MKHVYELAMPALVEFALSEAFERGRIDHGSKGEKREEDQAEDHSKPAVLLDQRDHAQVGTDQGGDEGEPEGGVHGSGSGRAIDGIERRAALVIARTADWYDIQRSRVIAVVVLAGLGAAVHAYKGLGSRKATASHGSANLGASALALANMLGSAREAHLPETAPRAMSGLSTTAADDLSHGLGRLLLLELGENRAFDDLEVHQPRWRNRTLLLRLRVNPKPLAYSLRRDLAELGDLTGSTEGLNDVG